MRPGSRTAHRAVAFLLATAWSSPLGAQEAHDTSSTALLAPRAVGLDGRVSGFGNGQFRTWQAGAVTDHGVAAGFDVGRALGANDHGALVGDHTKLATGEVRASLFLLAPAHGLPAGHTLLPSLGGDTTAHDVNVHAEVVGVSVDGGGHERAFVWLPAAAYGLPAGITDLGTLGGATSRALAIDDHGAIAGAADDGSGTEKPALWLPAPAYGLSAGWNLLGTLGGAGGQAHDLTNAGTVVGWSQVAGGARHAFEWNPSSGMNDLSVLPGFTHSTAEAVDALGRVVGWCEDDGQGGPDRAFLWSDEALTDLNQLLPASANLHLSRAYGVSGDGAIVAEGDAGGPTLAVRLTPPSAPADTVSREVSVAVDDGQPHDVVSREVSVDVPHPDLVFDPTGFAFPQQGLPGEAFTVSWVAENSGSKSATGPWFDRVLLSTDDVAGNDTLLESVQIDGPLAPDASYGPNRTFTYPETPGDYWIVVRLDDTDVVEEGTGDLDNVQVLGPIEVLPGPRPDLVVTSIVPPNDHVLSGTTTIATVTVKNDSTESATQVASWRDVAFLVTAGSPLGATLKDEDFVGDAGNPIWLPPQQSYTVAVPITLPNDIQGTFEVAAVTDARRPANPNAWLLDAEYDVPEEDESNNLLQSAPFLVDLEPQPDLVPALGIVPSNAASGTSIPVQLTVTNAQAGPTDANGAGGSSQWSDRVWLSTDANPSISAGDQPVATIPRAGPPLLQGSGYTITPEVFVPPELSGTWYVKVETDVFDQVTELGFESNNVVASGAIAVTPSLAPNLLPMSVAGTGPALLGHGMPVTWDVDNPGNNTLTYAATWSDRVYLSVDQTLDPGVDVLLGTYSQAAAPGGGSWSGSDYTRTAVVDLPLTLSPGNAYWILLSVDHEDDVFEAAGESDNVLASATPITPVDAPSDLAVAVNFGPRDLLPSSGAPGQTVTATWKVTNGSASEPSAAAWTDSLHLSTAPDLTGANWKIGSVHHAGGLAPSASYVGSLTAPLPFVQPGSYHLVVVAAEQATVYESATANNVASAPFTITADGADLQVTAVGAAAQSAPGEPIQVTWTVTNAGNLATSKSAWTDSVYLEQGGASILLGQKTNVGALAAGQSGAESGSFVPPKNLSGVYDVRVETDSSGLVFETNEANNGAAAGTVLNVDGLPTANLVVSSVAAPATVDSGKQLGVTWQIDNIGAGPTESASWFDTVHLSSDELLNPSQDLAVGVFEHSAPLAPGTSRQVTTTVQVPAYVSGPYFVYVRTDAGGEIEEDAGEGDNAGHDPGLTFFDLSEPADLKIASPQLVGSAIRGQLATFQWTVQNLASDPALTGWSDAVYLSTDAVWDEGDALVGHVSSPVTTLAGGGSALVSTSLAVPAIDPGPYHVIVKGDAFNQVLETDDANNDASSAQTTQVTAVPITLGSNPVTLAAGQQAVYEIDLTATPPNSSVRFRLDHFSPTAWTELYVRRGEVPSPGQYDLRFDAPALPDQVVTVPDSAPDVYYLLARNVFDVGGAGTAGDLVAEVLPEGVVAVLPSAVGQGLVTVELNGSGFSKVTGVELRHATAPPIADVDRRPIDGTRLLVEFDTTGAELGAWDVVALTSTGSFTLPSALTVQEATPRAARVTVATSKAIKKGHEGVALVRIENESNVNLAAVSVAVGLQPDGDVTVSSFDLQSVAPLPTADGEFFLIEALNLGPQQTAETTLQIGVAGAYGGESVFVLPLGVGGRVVDRTGLVLDLLFQHAEDLRSRILSDPASPTPLLQMAVDASAWWTMVLAHEGFDAAGQIVPAAVTPGSLAARSITIFDEDAPGTNAALARHVAVAAADLACAFDASLCVPAVQELLVEDLGNELRAASAGLTLGATLAATTQSPSCSAPGDEVSQVLSAGGGGGGVGTVCLPTPTSKDPNDKRPPVGFGPEQWIGAQGAHEYRIFFENDPDALSAAGEVVITDELSTDFDWASFRIGDIRFGDEIVEVPENSMTYSDVLDLTATHGVLLEVFAGFDAAAGTAVWNLKSLDPETGQPPVDGSGGFLPPNNAAGDGQGSVTFSVATSPNVGAGTSVKNRAKIFFDANSPIVTGETVNKVDAGVPTATLVGTPGVSEATEVELTWSGSEPAADATGIAQYVLWVRKDGGAYAPVYDGTDTSLSFVGEHGSTYELFTTAADNAGNVEPEPPQPEAVVSFGTDCNSNGVADFVEIDQGTATDCDGNGVPDDCQTDLDRNGVADACDALAGDVVQLSASAGGTQVLTLDAGAANGGRAYWIVGSISGTSPGFPVDLATIPLNPDSYLLYTAKNPNGSLLQGSLGQLDANGTATAFFVLPPATTPAAVGTTVHHAYALYQPLVDFASNPWPVTIDP